MLLEVLIILEIVAFCFLALGIIPYKQNPDGSIPILNKIIFILVGAIIFFMLSLTVNAYEYTYCFVNETSADFSLNATYAVATCDAHIVSNPGLSALNLWMGVVSIVLMIIMVLFALRINKLRFEDEGQQEQ